MTVLAKLTIAPLIHYIKSALEFQAARMDLMNSSANPENAFPLRSEAEMFAYNVRI